VIRCWSVDAVACIVTLELGAWLTGVEHIADVGAASGELVTRCFDVGDDQVQARAEPGGAVVMLAPN
jgi:hypothetical protein